MTLDVLLEEASLGYSVWRAPSSADPDALVLEACNEAFAETSRLAPGASLAALAPTARHRLTEPLRRGRPARVVFDGPDGAAWVAHALHAKAALILLTEPQADLAQQTRRHHAALEAMADAVILTDDGGRIVAANHAADRLLEVSPGALVGRPIEDWMPPGYAAAHAGWMWRYLEGGAPRIIGKPREVVARTATGQDVPVRLSVVPYRVGDTVGFVGSLHDLRQVRSLETQLRRAQQIEALGTLSAEVAHDLRNLLQAVQGNVEDALETHPDDPELHATLGDVLRANRQATELCQSLLDFARADDAPQDPCVDLVEETRSMVPVLERTVAPTCSLVVEAPDHPLYVPVSAAGLGQLLMNLVLNARDAMPEGGRVTLSLTTGDACVCLAVADEGEGIPKDLMGRIFDPFFTTKPAGVGTGLGLSTVFRIAHHASGRVDVHSEVGVGTRFEVCMPRLDDGPRRTV